MAKKNLRCRLGIHSWQNHRNSEGQRYVAKMLSDNFAPAIGVGEAQPVAAQRKGVRPAALSDES